VQEDIMAFKVVSPDFANNRPIPVRYTMDGENISPHLQWSGVPRGTQTLALILRDTDAPGGDFIHWVVYNLPPDLEWLPAGLPKIEVLRELDNARQGINDERRFGYAGPAPPGGETHSYHLQLFALDAPLDLQGRVTAVELEEAMGEHIIARAETIGTYRRLERRRAA
jgi:Raf kinase inhibitor-like YbhB/YbcL family protein